MSIMVTSVGEYIRELRTNKGLPLRKLAYALDIDTSTLAKMEKGQRPFSLDMAPIIAKELEVDFKMLQIALLSALIIQEIKGEEYAKEGLLQALENMSK